MGGVIGHDAQRFRFATRVTRRDPDQATPRQATQPYQFVPPVPTASGGTPGDGVSSKPYQESLPNGVVGNTRGRDAYPQ